MRILSGPPGPRRGWLKAGQPDVTSTPVAFLACGAAIAATFAGLAESDARLGSTGYVTYMGVAAAVYSVAMALLFRGRVPSGPILVGCVALGFAARAPLVARSPGALHDAHRYIWDARLQRAGLNPYLVTPDDPAAARHHTRETRTMNNPDVPSPYPPGAQYFFRLVTSVQESVTAIKIALVACELLSVLFMHSWLRARGLPPGWTLLYVWHPVVIFETAGGAHLDALGTMLLLLSAASLARRRGMVASLAFAASISIKFLPLVLAPMFARRVRARHAAAGAGLLAALYIPFLDGWRVAPGAMGTFVDRFRFNQLAFEWLEAPLSARVAVGAAVIVGLAVALFFSMRRGQNASGFAWPMGAALLLSPVIYPWYLIWLVPFALERAALPLLVWSLAIISTYRTWALGPGERWAVSSGALSIQYVSMVAAVLVVAAVQRRAGGGDSRLASPE